MTGNSGELRWVEETRSQRKGVRVATAEVENALARPSVGRQDRWRRELNDRLTSLARAFERHIEVAESPTGILESVASEQPRLIHRAERLRRDHQAIQQRIARLIVELPSDRQADNEDIAEIRTLVTDLLRQLAYHRYLGAELVYQVYSVDIEAVD